ncbi:DNA alkylation repair protein [Oligoflexia bacterium]|nr:DNA alkylation repair protein [Oligoflexia bacterium]
MSRPKKICAVIILPVIQDEGAGRRVPDVRKVARQHQDLSLAQVKKLLVSSIHEERLCALLILVAKFSKGDTAEQKAVYDFYLSNLKGVNNWDLVDLSADKVVGAYLLDRSKKPLYRLVRSKVLWERRIAIIATFHFIKHDEFEDSVALAEKLLDDDHDLIHKAVGWMLREIGKRNLKAEETFLKKHYHAMPRTMLRYAIERFPETKRQRYLKGRV